MSKNTFPDFGITRIGHLRAEIQHIIEILWPFWIMQIRYFPILGFLRTFSMVFWGPHRNSLWQKKFCCNLFQVKPYFAWTNMPASSGTHIQNPTPSNLKQYNAAQPDVSCKTTIDMPASQPCSSTSTYLHYNNAAAIPKSSCYTESDTN